MPVYKARLSQNPDATWTAAAVQLPLCWSRGASRDEALARLRDEIRYRIEYCPCSGVDDEYVRVEVEALSQPAAAPVPRSWDAARASTPAPLAGAAGCPATPSRAAPEPGTRPAPEPEPVAPLMAPPMAPLRAAPGPPSLGWRRWDD